MHDPVLTIDDPSDTLSLLVAMADYAAAFPVSGEAAIAAARHCLIDALARGFEALRDPQCAALVGPIVPGAVMPGGSRVPGTSLELEPAQAAFCISLMLCRPAGGERWPAPGGARAADSLGAILSTADYQARKAMMEGRPPPKVRDVLAALLKALEIQGVLAAFDEDYAAGGSPLRLARVAATAMTAAQLGGTQCQIIRAVGHACIDGGMYLHRDERLAVDRKDWAWADTIGRAVRHACQAMACGTPTILTSGDLEVVSLAGILPDTRSVPRKPFGTTHIDRLAGLQRPRDAERLTSRFRAAVDRCFPARQAQRVKALFAAPERLDDLPVNELIAALVTNGAR
jgi:2-methylcitrate dehydratase PrpD